LRYRVSRRILLDSRRGVTMETIRDLMRDDLGRSILLWSAVAILNTGLVVAAAIIIPR
jgi:hypothetical protein